MPQLSVSGSTLHYQIHELTAPWVEQPQVVLFHHGLGSTSGLWSGRILGQSANIKMPFRPAWIATANNPTFTTETARRWHSSRRRFQHAHSPEAPPYPQRPPSRHDRAR